MNIRSLFTGKKIIGYILNSFVLIVLIRYAVRFTIVGDTSFAFNERMMDLSIIPFALIGGLYGYVVSFIFFLGIFITKLVMDGYTAHVMAVYMMSGFLIAMAAQYRWFRTIPRAIGTFIVSDILISIVSGMSDMVRRRNYVYRSDLFEGYIIGYSLALFATCLFLYLFFNFAPDIIKGLFPIGVGYTREYVCNLLLQNALKKTRLSVKITFMISTLAVILGLSAGVFANFLMPDMQTVMERRDERRQLTENNSGNVPSDMPEIPPDARATQTAGNTSLSDMMEGDYDIPAMEDRFDSSMYQDRYLISFNLKLFLMMLCIGFPIVGLINFFAKMKVCMPIGELSAYMMSFMDTTDDNRMEYAESIRKLEINTHDEIADLYRALSTTVMETTEYIQDIRQEARLREDLRVAQAASEAKSSFLSNMSHEIRTPINAVLGMDEMILRESDDPEILRYASDIRSAGNTLLSLVNDILDFSKIEAGKMDILPVQYQLSSVINDLVNMVRERAEYKGLELILHVDGTVPNMLYGDEIRIKQCVTNILTNAVKYTEKGSITLEVGWKRIEDTDPGINSDTDGPTDKIAVIPGTVDDDENVINNDGGVIADVNDGNKETDNDRMSQILLCIKVSDTGIGIKEEDLAKLFSPFERIEEIRNRTIEGTGLGMSIVKKLLALMDTKMIVKSVYGEGSEFSFEVVQGVVDTEPMGDFEERYKEMMRSQKKYSESFRAPSAKILVTDDTRMNLTVVKGLLKQTLIDVDTAGSGKETLDKAVRNRYDLIFLDHRMPEMDGIETRAALYTLEGNLNTDVPCIALTANAVSGAREEYLAAGFADYLSKPIDSAKLEKMLMEYLPDDKVLRPGDPGFDDAVPEGSAFRVGDEDSGKEGEYAGIRDRFSSCTGIDIDEALKNTGSAEVLEDVIKDFTDSIQEKSDLIEKLLAEGDIRGYTVQVHALKSSARIIGAGKLSEMAAHLEKCGNEYGSDSDRTELDEKTPELLELYRSYIEKLGGNEKGSGDDEDGDDPSRPEIPEDELLSALSDLKELVEAYDMTSAEQILKMLSDYRYPASCRQRMKDITRAVGSMDRDRILSALDA